MPTLSLEEKIAALWDKDQIRDEIYKYTRAIDRVDEDLYRDRYWEDAVDDHGIYKATREAYLKFVLPNLKRMEQTQHLIGNCLIELDGHRAKAESYFYAYHRLPNEEGKIIDFTMGGRYLDTFEKRGDEWRVIHRGVAYDWLRIYDDSADWEAGGFGFTPYPATGHRWPTDPLYAFLAEK